MDIFFDNFNCAQDVFDAYNVSESDQANIEFLYAQYSYEDYSGSSHVIFFQDGELLEAYGSHCSCSGLEGQWSPEITSPDAILYRQGVDKRAINNIKEYYKNLLSFM